MSNQIVITSGAKVRSLEGVLTGTSGIVSSVPLGAANGVATLDALGKVPLSQLPASVVTYLGTWNAATNTPTLTNGTGDVGDLYICNVAGTVNFGAGPITFASGDWVIYNGSQWQKSAGASGTVTSVGLASTAGAFTITNSPITTSGNIGLNFAGNSGQYVAGDGSLITFPSIITQAQNLVTEVYNETGATLTKGTVVYINGGHGNLPTITKAIATGDATSAQTYGMVRADITNNNNGYVTVIGNLENMDTQAYADGTQLYLSSTTAGAYTSVKQYAPAHLVYVGIVVRSHPTQGVIEVRIQNGFELDELHNVSAQTPSNNQGIFYNSSTSLWENKSIATALGYTPADDSLVVKLAGTQTITGAKTFSGDTIFNGGVDVNNSINLNSGVFLRNNAVGSTLYTNFSIFKDANLENLKYIFSTSYYSNLVFYNTANYTYQFPASSGTIALSSDLSSYVPYSGATADVDLGTRYFKATGVQTESAFALKILSSGTAFQNGYSVMSSLAGTFSITQAISAGNLKSMTFDFSAWTINTSYTYTLPAANGTIALTSNLSSYVPYTGATTNVNLGSYDLTGSYINGKQLTVNKNGTTGGSLFIETGAGFGYAGSSGIALASGTNDYLTIRSDVATVYKQVNLSLSGITTSATRVISFPDASGTLALISDIPSLSGYVPYTGATSALNLGTNSVSASVVNANGNGSNAGQIFMKHGSGFSLTAGYASIGSDTSYNLYFYNTVSAATKGFILNAGSLTTGTNRTYTLPDATGTLVLGTGTTNYHAKFTGASTLGNSLIWDNGTNVGIGNTNTTYTFDVTGTGRFTGALTAASAKFSGSRPQGIFTENGTTGLYLRDATSSSYKSWSIGTNDIVVGFAITPSTAVNGTTFTTPALVINESSNVGIGTSSPTAKLSIVADWVAGGATVRCYPVTAIASGGVAGYGMFDSDGTTRKGYINVSSNYMEVWCQQNTPMTFGTNDIERMRITSGGNVLIGTTTSNNTPLEIECGSGGDAIYLKRSGAVGQIFMGGTTSGTAITFVRTAGSGGVRLDSGATAWTSASDERLKNINGTIQNALDSLLTLRAVNFSWKSDETNKNNLGLIAQDIEKVFPEAVTLDEENDVLGVRYTELIPVLVKAIQEQNQLISELSAKVSALENKS